jgi:hypothetical protein
MLHIKAGPERIGAQWIDRRALSKLRREGNSGKHRALRQEVTTHNAKEAPRLACAVLTRCNFHLMMSCRDVSYHVGFEAKPQAADFHRKFWREAKRHIIVAA